MLYATTLLNILHGQVLHTCITFVMFLSVLHVFYMCNTCIYITSDPTHLLHLYFYTHIYTPV